MQVKDGIGNLFEVNTPPLRIVSLVPSLTELLSDLGLEEEVVGITKFCVHPPNWRREKTIIGGTKNPNIEAIRSLEPDLVIASKEENLENHVQEIEEFAPVFVTDVKDYPSALDTISQLGIVLGKERAAESLKEDIQDVFDQMPQPDLGSAVYLIWAKPYMTVGGDTYIHAMLEKAGFNNPLEGKPRYPQISLQAIQEIQPDYILLSSEPFPFKSEHVLEWKNRLPNTKVMLVDGEMFSWYGSRMRLAPDYFRSLTI